MDELKKEKFWEEVEIRVILDYYKGIKLGARKSNVQISFIRIHPVKV